MYEEASRGGGEGLGDQSVYYGSPKSSASVIFVVSGDTYYVFNIGRMLP